MSVFQNTFHDELLNMATCSFQKDSNGRYQYCNARFAQLAGLTSQQEIVGLTDMDFPWYQQAAFFKRVLNFVLAGNSWMNRIQSLLIEDQCHNILISVFPRVECGELKGIMGSFIDMADIKPANILNESNPLQLMQSNVQGYDDLTKSERKVLHALLTGHSNEAIGQELHLAKRTIDSYVEIIKSKLACASKAEVIAFSYRSGLAYLLKNQE